MKKIVVVLADGKVETIFSNEEVEVEIVDFDSAYNEEEQEELGDYVDECRETMKEIIC
jgi:glutathionyl-hydroquinone reductase